MSEQKETDKRDDVLQEKKVTNEEMLRYYQILIGILHEGISQLTGEVQDFMVRKHAEANVKVALEVLGRWSGRDPKTYDVDEMTKEYELIEKQYSNGGATITREGNIITWKSNLSYCYDPKIEHGFIKPYPAYCDYCSKYFFEGLYGFAHKGPVKTEGLKGVLKGDNECLTRIELL